MERFVDLKKGYKKAKEETPFSEEDMRDYSFFFSKNINDQSKLGQDVFKFGKSKRQNNFIANNQWKGARV